MTDIRPMTMDDYEEVHRLWTLAEGLSVEEDDERDRIALYLQRNRGLCFVATCGNQMAGTVLCGHDGRRGILRHLAVHPAFRGRGIGRSLVDRCLAALDSQGIRRCNLFVLDSNVSGRRFWEHLGWRCLEYDFRMYQAPSNQGKE